jgi:hypothetical protein
VKKSTFPIAIFGRAITMYTKENKGKMQRNYTKNEPRER